MHPVSAYPPDPPTPLLEEQQEAYCYGHPKTPTRLRCSRCGRPICGRCAIPASVGQHCPECVAEARRTAPRVRHVSTTGTPAVFAILLINALFFIAQQVVPGGGAFGLDVLARNLALYEPAIADGQWYRLLTPMVLHAGIIHIALNSLALYFIGPNVEQAFGSRRFVVMYVIAGFTGSAASYAFGHCPELGVGASGAIFGILGVLLVYVFNRRQSAIMSHYLRNILFIILLNIVFGLSIPNIDVIAHLGGLVGGVLLGAGFDRQRMRAKLPIQVATAAAVIALGTALVAWRTATFVCG